MSVCADQTAFNKALDNYAKAKEPKKDVMMLLVGLYLVFLVWALILALTLKTDNKAEKVINVVLAILFPPVYVIGFYTSDLKVD